MASSDRDRDRNNQNTSDESKNPFIRFRRFADEKIGTVLQGIIGLPSAFSRQPHDANARWNAVSDDFETKAQAHDERQTADVKEIRSAVGQDDKEVEIPVKKSRGWDSEAAPMPAPDQPIVPPYLSAKFDKDTIELFSPVSKALFADVPRGAMPETQWPGTTTRAGFIPSMFEGGLAIESLLQRELPELSTEQKSKNVMQMIRSMVWNDLNETAMVPGWRQDFHSQSSVLPYLLFSEYSPLNLTELPPSKAAEGLSSLHADEYPYCAAFEDLLLASQGRPMGVRIPVASNHISEYRKTNASRWIEESPEVRKAKVGVDWLYAMLGYDLMSQPSEDPWDMRWPGFIIGSSPWHLKVIDVNQYYGKPGHSRGQGPDTEADMYDELERHFPVGVKGIFEAAVETIRNTLDREFSDHQASNKSADNARGGTQTSSATQTDPSQPQPQPTNPPRDSGLSSILHRVLDMFEKGLDSQTRASHERALPEYKHRPRTEERVLAEYEKRPAAAFEAVGDTKGAQESEAVSTTTTTSQTTHQDGTVETVTTVKRVFADGSVAVQETRSRKAGKQTREAVHCDLGDDEDWEDDEDGNDWPSGEGLAKKEDNEKAERKKGWFWN